MNWTLTGICIAAMLFNTFAEAKIYRWKDKNGNWVYSDKPKKGSQKVKLNAPMVMPSTNTDILQSNQNTKPIAYQASISSPSHEQTIRENTGTVYITGQVTPSFHKGFMVQLFHNGNAVGPKQSTTSFVLKSLSRGEHKLKMAVYNPQGKAIATSPESTFFLHKASVANR